MEWRDGEKIICVTGGKKCCVDIIGEKGRFSNDGDCVPNLGGTSN